MLQGVGVGVFWHCMEATEGVRRLHPALRGAACVAEELGEAGGGGGPPVFLVNQQRAQHTGPASHGGICVRAATQQHGTQHTVNSLSNRPRRAT